MIFGTNVGGLGWEKLNDNFFMSEYELPSPITIAATYRTQRITMAHNTLYAILDTLDSGRTIIRKEGLNSPMNAKDVESFLDAAVVEHGSNPNETREMLNQDEERLKQEAEFLKQRDSMRERIVVDKTLFDARIAGLAKIDGKSVTDKEHIIIARSISSYAPFAGFSGKTLYGCSYREDLPGEDGKPI